MILGLLKSISFVLDKLFKFVTNQFINKYDSDYSFGSVVPDKQRLISNFGFAKLILRDFIFNFWIVNDNMIKLVDLGRVLKNSRVFIVFYIYF